MADKQISKETQGQFTESGFWNVMRKVGRKVAEPALKAYYAMMKPSCPAWARAVLIGALAYLILPIDAIPDVIPVVGFTDDLGVLLAALRTVASEIDEEVEAQAAAKAEAWFG